MSDDKPISYQPTAGLTYDPSDGLYWDGAALRMEIDRVFEVCNGCRMCFKFCDSFPDLFTFLDGEAAGNTRKLTDAQVDQVMHGCFQCKLCEVQCPYTPRDGHEFQLDFPKLVHRYRAQQAKAHGLTLRDRVLGDPDALGRVGRASLGLANKMNKVAAHRWLMEKVLGIHRSKDLPDFAPVTFEAWAERTGKVGGPGEGEAVLFQTCYVQNNEPHIGRDTLEVLEANQIRTVCAKGLECCGMPRWEHGDLEGLRRQARANLDKLTPYAEAGMKIVAINPTCSMMLRREYPELVAPEDRERAAQVAAAVVDPGELLWSIRKEERFNTDFKSSPGDRVAYHAPCHLRAQAVGFRGRDVLKKIPGVQIGSVLECCGHDGTFAMTTEGFEASIRVGRKAFDEMADQDAQIWVTDCPLAALQFKQHAGVKPMHPMSVLARAYRENGFDTPKQLAGPARGEEGE